MLPATWGKQDARQIALSVTEVLVRMLGLEFAFVALRWEDRPAMSVARTAERSGPDRSAAIWDALAPAQGEAPFGQVVSLANPLGGGRVRAIAQPIAVGQDSLIVAASRRAGFPGAAERLLLGVAANQTAIAIRQWQAEQALQLLNETLEQRVEAEVDGRMQVEKAYRQAQKMEVVGQLTGGIAHDFNNLLAAVLGNLQLLRKRLADDADGLRLIGGAIEGAERGKALTQRLLAFARQQDLRPATVDTPKLIRGTIELLARSIGPSVEIRSDIASDLWPVRVDANHLELALLNLGVNARDAMPDGGTITLSARNETVDPGRASRWHRRLRLPDRRRHWRRHRSGDARPRHRPVLHDQRRRQGHRPRPVDGRRHGGAVGRLAEAVELPGRRHHGRAAAAVRRGPARDPRRRRRPRGSVDPLQDPAGRRRSGLHTTSSMLADLGHEVREAPSGKAALEILHAGAVVDLVLTDQAMPGMTGMQLAAQIRTIWPELPVMLRTGYAELPDRQGLKLPRLVKPYGQEEMAAAIASLMRPRQ